MSLYDMSKAQRHDDRVLKLVDVYSYAQVKACISSTREHAHAQLEPFLERSVTCTWQNAADDWMLMYNVSWNSLRSVPHGGMKDH